MKAKKHFFPLQGSRTASVLRVLDFAKYMKPKREKNSVLLGVRLLALCLQDRYMREEVLNSDCNCLNYFLARGRFPSGLVHQSLLAL